MSTAVVMDNRTDAPPPPPKDIPIPATLRLGTNLLGLGLGPMPGDDAASQTSPRGKTASPVVVVSSSTPPHPHKPTHFMALRSASPTPLSPPDISSHSKQPSSPSTIRSNKMGQRYMDNSQSSSSVSLSNKSTRTVTPGSPASRATPTSVRGRSTSSDWGWKRGGSSTDRPALNSSASSSAIPILGRKRSSGQLLTGIGKGLGRMGSVMRRNTSDAVTTPHVTPDKASGMKSRAWRKKGKERETVLEEDPWESVEGRRPSQGKVDPVPGDEGDAGIGRPYNVEHDLHVSPSLEDLPPAWLESLRAQGLSEQDLMIIASARKRQQAVTNHAIKRRSSRAKGHSPHVSEPLKSLHSLSTSTGPPSSEMNTSTDEWRRRGASSSGVDATSSQGQPPTGEPSAASSASATGSSEAGRPPRMLQKFSFEPSADAAVPSGPFQANLMRSEEVKTPIDETDDTAGEMLDFGGGRRRTPKKNKRMSDQLRCFSQFDVGGEEGWAASLLSAMNAEESAAFTALVGPAASTSTAENGASPSSPRDPRPTPSPLKDADPVETAPVARDRSASDSSTGSGPKTPSRVKTIKRIPIPPLLAQTTPEPTLDLNDLGITSSQPEPRALHAPRPPPPQRRSSPDAITNSPEAPSLVGAADFTPLRKSSESFGVHYSQSKSSVDLDLVTPSSSSHPERRATPPSSDDGDEDLDDGSILDFGGALREASYDYTPGSSVSKELKEYKEYLPSGFDTPPRFTRTSQVGSPALMSPYTPRDPADPAYSVPASISSSLPSRSASPEPNLPSIPMILRHGLRPGATEDRSSLTYSVMSSDSGHGHLHNSLHEATVQTAYTKVLGRLQEEAHRRESGGVGGRVSVGVGRIAEEAEGGEAGDGEGASETCSALDALDEAARRFAGAHN